MDETQQQSLQQIADDGREMPIKADHQSSVHHVNTASGLKYDKASTKDSSDKMKNPEVCNNTTMYVCKNISKHVHSLMVRTNKKRFMQLSKLCLKT